MDTKIIAQTPGGFDSAYTPPKVEVVKVTTEEIIAQSRVTFEVYDMGWQYDNSQATYDGDIWLPI